MCHGSEAVCQLQTDPNKGELLMYILCRHADRSDNISILLYLLLDRVCMENQPSMQRLSFFSFIFLVYGIFFLKKMRIY